MTKTAASEQKLVDTWNLCRPVGTLVRYWKGARGDNEHSDTARTRSAAELLGGHTSVVWVEGEGACIALSHIEPIARPLSQMLEDLLTCHEELVDALPVCLHPGCARTDTHGYGSGCRCDLHAEGQTEMEYAAPLRRLQDASKVAKRELLAMVSGAIAKGI